MTIQNPSTGPVQPNSARGDEASHAQEAAQSGEAQEPQESASADEASTGDQVEISDAARTAHSEVGGDTALIERGRQALEGSSLSEERLAELQQRVESGHYTQPEVTQQIAEGLAEDIGAPPGSASS